METLLDLVMSLRMCSPLQYGALKPADGFIQIIPGLTDSALTALILQLKMELSVKAWNDFVALFLLPGSSWLV